MSDMRVYDPLAHIITWGEIQFEFLADGDFIEGEHDEDAVTTTTGAYGDVAFTINAARTATVTVRLMNISPTNAVLAALAASNRPRGSKLIVKPFTMADLNGTTVVFGEQAIIQKAAPVTRGKEHGNSEWVFRIADAEIFAGGSLAE